MLVCELFEQINAGVDVVKIVPSPDRRHRYALFSLGLDDLIGPPINSPADVFRELEHHPYRSIKLVVPKQTYNQDSEFFTNLRNFMAQMGLEARRNIRLHVK